MRKLRVNDFDPNAVPELGSPLDNLPAIEQPASPSITVEEKFRQHQHVVVQSPAESTPGRPSERVPVRTPVRVKRTITRYAFEFFQDQIELLKQFSLDEQLQGERGSMSQMVREALDAYIAKRTRTEE